MVRVFMTREAGAISGGRFVVRCIEGTSLTVCGRTLLVPSRPSRVITPEHTLLGTLVPRISLPGVGKLKQVLTPW